MTTTVSNRKSRALHKAREAHSFRRATQESPGEEIQRLRQQIMGLRSAVTEQEETIAFLRDLLAQRWFDDAE